MVTISVVYAVASSGVCRVEYMSVGEVESLARKLKLESAEEPLKRALVVEDYEPFRRFLCSILQELRDVAICEESDGIEAVRKAQELEPDLVVLDMNLPRLSGFEVARKIRAVSPQSKILNADLRMVFRVRRRGFSRAERADISSRV